MDSYYWEIIDWIFYPLLMFLGMLILWLKKYYSQDEQIMRSVEEVRVSSLRSVKKGDRVKISGVIIAPDELLTAPISGKKCVAYQLEVCQVVSGSYGDVDAEIIRDEKSLPFYIEEKGHQVKIPGRYQEISLHKEIREESDWLNGPSAELTKILKKHGKKTSNFLGLTKRFIFKEGVLEVGEKIVVVGKGYWFKPTHEGPSVLVMEGSLEEPLLISDQLRVVDQ